MKLSQQSGRMGGLLALLFVLLLVGQGAAQASTATGVYGTATVAGVPYGMYNLIAAPTVYAQTRVETTNGSSVGAGWMGTRARLYAGSALCRDGGWKYNSGTAAAMSSIASPACGYNAYHSAGIVQMWNGTTSYNTYWPGPSPNLNGS